MDSIGETIDLKANVSQTLSHLSTYYYVLQSTWNALGSWGFVLCILSTLVSSVFPDFPSSYLLLHILSIHQFRSWRIHSWCLLFSSPNIADIRWGSICCCLRKGIFPKLNGLYVTSFVFTQREVFWGKKLHLLRLYAV